MAVALRAGNEAREIRGGQGIARWLTALGLVVILALQSAGPAWASVLGPTPSSIAPPLPERPLVRFDGENRDEAIASLALPLVALEDLHSGWVENPSAAAGSVSTLKMIQLAWQGRLFIVALMQTLP